jgi:hypothetical protein
MNAIEKHAAAMMTKEAWAGLVGRGLALGARRLGTSWIPKIFRPSTMKLTGEAFGKALTASKAAVPGAIDAGISVPGYTGPALNWAGRQAAKLPTILTPPKGLTGIGGTALTGNWLMDSATDYGHARADQAGRMGVDQMNNLVNTMTENGGAWETFKRFLASFLPPDVYRGMVNRKATEGALKYMSDAGLNAPEGYGPRKWLKLDQRSVANKALNSFLNESAARTLDPATYGEARVDWPTVFDYGEKNKVKGILDFKNTLKPEQINALTGGGR